MSESKVLQSNVLTNQINNCSSSLIDKLLDNSNIIHNSTNISITKNNNYLNNEEDLNSSKSNTEKSSFDKFINNNIHFFSKIGLDEFLNDPIFKLNENEEVLPVEYNKKNIKDLSVEDITCICCNFQIDLKTSIFNKKTNTYCRYCGLPICNICYSKLNKNSSLINNTIQNNENSKLIDIKNNKIICKICLIKFDIFYEQIKFKNEFENIELEIKNSAYNTEIIGLKLSESLSDIDKYNNKLEELEHDNNLNKKNIKNNIDMHLKEKDNCNLQCSDINKEIDALINTYKNIDNEYNIIFNVHKNINIERDNMYKDFIFLQDKLNKLNKENQELSFEIQNQDKQINKRIVIDYNKDYKVIYLEKIKKNIKNNNDTMFISNNILSKIFYKIKNYFI